MLTMVWKNRAVDLGSIALLENVSEICRGILGCLNGWGWGGHCEMWWSMNVGQWKVPKWVFVPCPPCLSSSSLDIHVRDMSAIVHLSLEPNIVSHINTNMFCSFSFRPIFQKFNYQISRSFNTLELYQELLPILKKKIIFVTGTLLIIFLSQLK